MRKQLLRVIHGPLCALSLALFVLICSGCPGHGGGSVPVSSCSELNNDKVACNKAKQSDGNKCKYDETSNTCIVDLSQRQCSNIKRKTACDAVATCYWDEAVFPSVCKDKKAGASKTVKVYTLTRLAKNATHAIDSNNLAGLTASGNGKFIYVVGSEAATLKSYDVGKNKWDSAVGDWNDSMDLATDHLAGLTPDLRAERVAQFAPYEEGLIFGITGDKGLVVLKGTDGANTSLYPQGAGGGLNNGNLLPFFASGGARNYLYVVNQTAAANSVLFRPYVAPPGNDAGPWNNSLVKKAGVPLSEKTTALTLLTNGNLLLADREGLRILSQANIGTDGAALLNDGNPVIPIAELKIENATANDQGITTMASLGGDEVLIGFRSNAPNNGGLVMLKVTPVSILREGYGAGKQITVNAISVEKHGPKKAARALISTDKGLLIFDNGTLIAPAGAGTGELVDHAYLTANKSNTASFDTAKSGFAGDTWLANANNVVGAGQQEKDNLWYLAVKGHGPDDGGVFSLKIEEVSVKY